MKNFYLILSCCALFSLTAHSENFSGDDFNGAWESDGGHQKVQPVGWHALYSNISGFTSMKAGTVSKSGDDTNAYTPSKTLSQAVLCGEPKRVTSFRESSH